MENKSNNIVDKFYYKYKELSNNEDSSEIQAKKMAEFARVEFNDGLKELSLKIKGKQK